MLTVSSVPNFLKCSRNPLDPLPYGQLLAGAGKKTTKKNSGMNDDNFFRAAYRNKKRETGREYTLIFSKTKRALPYPRFEVDKVTCLS